MKTRVALLLAASAATQQACVTHSPTTGQSASAPAAQPPSKAVTVLPQVGIVALDSSGRAASEIAPFEPTPVDGSGKPPVAGPSRYVGEIPSVSGVYEPPSPAMVRYEESDEAHRGQGITLIPGPGPLREPRGVLAPPEPLRPAQSYLTRADYPHKLPQGTLRSSVRLFLIIGPAGRVRDCGIVRTSGSLALDRASCQVMAERAHFRPATDVDGHAVIGNIVEELDWKRR